MIKIFTNGVEGQCLKCNRTATNIWKKLNPAKARAQHRRWVERHPENWRRITRFCSLRWQRENRGKVAAKVAKRSAKKKEQLANLTEAELKEISILYEWAEQLPGKWEVDHIIPLSKGGMHHPDNLQIIPALQNSMKYTKCPKEFYGRFYEFLCVN